RSSCIPSGRESGSGDARVKGPEDERRLPPRLEKAVCASEAASGTTLGLQAGNITEWREKEKRVAPAAPPTRLQKHPLTNPTVCLRKTSVPGTLPVILRGLAAWPRPDWLRPSSSALRSGRRGPPR